MAFTPRTTCPDVNDKWWKTSFNPCITGSAHESKQYGTVLPNCVGYAWGRFAEVFGGYPKGLPNCNAGDWYASDTTHEKSNDPQKPQLGATIVFKKAGAAGHVAAVEAIERDSSGKVISITTSESGWGCAWSRRFWTQKRYPPNYANSPYTFVGFIYNPAVKGDGTSVVDISSPMHPARKFVATAEAHVGPNGHAWVQSKTSIGNQAWCAATCCAVAKECGFDGVIMPGDDYTAAGFGRQVVEKYGGTYLPGPMMGGASVPQVGDLIEYTNKTGRGDYGYGTKYSAYHIGIVRSVQGNKIFTVEGNTSGGQFAFHEYDINRASIGWYARPDWSKVGGGLAGLIAAGGQLYETLSTREDAAIREVGYIDQEGQPSIKPTGVKLSVINYTGLLSNFVKVFGGSSSGMSGSPDNIDGLEPVPREIVQYLTSKGMPTSGAIAVAANIEAESGYRTDAVGDHGTSFGICQWHNERGTAMKQMAGPNWANNLSGQLDFLWHELNTSYKSVLDQLMQLPNTLDGAKQGVRIFVYDFEKPSDKAGAVATRTQNAEKLWSQIVVNAGTTSSATVSAAQGKVCFKSGRAASSGTSVVIPDSVPQTGIVANYTSYSYFYGRWSKGTIQRQLSELWGAAGKPSSNGVATLNGYYLIAVAPVFGTTGDLVSVVFKDGTYFNAILGDGKGADAQSKWGHYLGNAVDIVEWEAVGSGSTNKVDQTALQNGLRAAGFLGKKVAKIVNYGSWING